MQKEELNARMLADVDIRLPTVSIVIPTFNEESNIAHCLDALLSQTYPRDLIELIVVDNVSHDRTAQIVAEYRRSTSTVRLLFNEEAKDAEVSKMIGFRDAQGELFMYLDADITVLGSNWLLNLVKPLMADASLAGSFPRFSSLPQDRQLGRYLGFHPLQLDPLLQFLCASIQDTVIARKPGYNVCRFTSTKAPPVGICLYRKSWLAAVLSDSRKFMDIDVPIMLAEQGWNTFAYVPSARIHHIHASSVTQLIRKRLRNVNQAYLPNAATRRFQYINFSNPSQVLRISLWVLYVNLLIPKALEGIWLTIRRRDIAGMYELVLSVVIADAVAVQFFLNREGRKKIHAALRTLLRQA